MVITASMAGMVDIALQRRIRSQQGRRHRAGEIIARRIGQVAPAIRVALLNPGMVKTNLIRTSAARIPSGASMSDESVQGMHDALNQAGVDPSEAVSWALRALQEGRFWALPDAGDPFFALLQAELVELGEVRVR